MISSLPIVQNLVTDTWVKIPWEDFLILANNPDYENSRFYYDQGEMRIEMATLGTRHGRNNSLISKVISLYASLKSIKIIEFTNTSFRKFGLREFQPDSSFYIGDELLLPPENNSAVDLNEYEPPTLIVEIGATSLNDNLGRKRLLYERAGVKEYWVIDAAEKDIIAFTINNRRSGEIEESLILPGLTMALVKEVLKRSETEDDGAITRWLLQIFSPI